MVSKHARLEVELETERQTASATLEAVERSAASRLVAVEAERDRSTARADRLEEELSRLREDAAKHTLHTRTSDEELSALRRELQQWQIAHKRLECDSELRLQQALADAQSETKAAAEQASSQVKQECEAGGKEAMMRAIWQLQSADDCMQTMRQQQTLEASTCAAQRRKVEEMERIVLEEGN